MRWSITLSPFKTFKKVYMKQLSQQLFVAAATLASGGRRVESVQLALAPAVHPPPKLPNAFRWHPSAD